MPHPFLLSYEHIPSSAYPLTSSTTRARTPLLWLTDIQTGPSLNRHKQDPRNVWHPRWVCDRWWRRVHRISHMPIPEGLGSTTLPVFCSPPTLKLQSRNWHQNCQTTHHQQHRPTWQSKHRCLAMRHTPILEHPWPCHKAVTCSMCIWLTYQWLHTHTSRPLHTSPHLEWHSSSQGGSPQKRAHERSWAVDSAHQEITTPCSRTPCAYSKPDRSTSQQVGHDRHHHRGPPIWPICSTCWWIR